jgi:hypothetical protein
MSSWKMWLGIAMVWGLFLAGFPTSASAATGTVQERVLTFTDVNTVNFTINTVALVPTPEVPEPTVILLLDFATDGSAAVPGSDPFTNLANVSFSLTYNGAAISDTTAGAPPGDFTFTAQATTTAPAFVTKEHTGSAPDVKLFAKQLRPGEYYISLGFPNGAAALTNGWSLAITGSGFPPSVRGHAYIDQGKFTSLATAAPCPSGGSPATCPPGQSCKGPCPLCPRTYCQRHPYACYLEVVWVPKFEPWPLPWPCLSCPEPWKEKFGDDFIRTLVTFVPMNKGGTELGSGKLDEIKLSVAGGRFVGDLVDLGGGEYAQLVETRKADGPARVSATIAGRSTKEFVAGPAPAPKTSPVASILAFLVGLALGAAALLMLRPRRGAAPKG